MKKAEVSSKCACGETLTGMLPKPSRIRQTVARLNCGECGSKFMIVAKVGRGQSVDMKAKELYISERAKHIIAVDLGLMKPE